MPKNKHITTDDLINYQSGKLSNSEMHQVEKQLLQQPLLTDANDGFEAIKNDAVSVEKNFSELRQRLKNRTEKTIVFQPKPFFSPTPIRLVAMAASVLVFVFVGIYFYNQNTDNQPLASKSVFGNKEKPNLEDSVIASDSEKKIAFNQSPKKEKLSAESSQIQYIEPEIKADEEAESQNISLAEVTLPAVQESPKATEKPMPSVSLPPTNSKEEKEEKIEEKMAKSTDSDKDTDENALIYSRQKNNLPARLSISNITGVVVDEEKKPLDGVTINLKGTSKGTKTNIDGKFYLDGLKKGDILIMNSFNQPSQEVYIRNPNVGTIIYSEDAPTIPGQPKVKIERSPAIPKDKNFSEAMPEFGQAAFDIYIKENLKKPQIAIEKGISGRITVEFKVDTTGEVSDFKLIRKLGFGCDEEAIRLIKEGQKWFPAQRYGEKEISRKRVSIKF